MGEETADKTEEELKASQVTDRLNSSRSFGYSDEEPALPGPRSQEQNGGTGVPVPAALPPGRPVPQQGGSHSPSRGFAGSRVRSDGAAVPGSAALPDRPAGPPALRPPHGAAAATGRPAPGAALPATTLHFLCTKSCSSSFPPSSSTLPKRCSAPPGLALSGPLTGLELGLPERSLPPQDVLTSGKCPRRAAAAGCTPPARGGGRGR